MPINGGPKNPQLFLNEEEKKMNRHRYGSGKGLAIIVVLLILVGGFFLFYDRSTGSIKLPSFRPSSCVVDTDCPSGQNCAMDTNTCVAVPSNKQEGDGICSNNANSLDADCPGFCAPGREGYAKFCCTGNAIPLPSGASSLDYTDTAYTIDCTTGKIVYPANFKNWAPLAKYDVNTLQTQALVTFGKTSGFPTGADTVIRNTGTNSVVITSPSPASLPTNVNTLYVYFSSTPTATPAWTSFTSSWGSATTCFKNTKSGESTPVTTTATAGCVGRINNGTLKIVTTAALMNLNTATGGIDFNTLTTGTTVALVYPVCYTYADTNDVFQAEICGTQNSIKYSIRRESDSLTFDVTSAI